MDSIFTQVGRAIGIALVEVLTFPWWWYTRGLRRIGRWMSRTLRGWERAVGLRLWAKNLFVPMFGQTDWQGRIISFFMRLMVLVGRLLQVLFGSIAVLVIVAVYLVLPPFVILEVLFAALAGLP
ncbi:MAG: hypothetical protein Q7S02_04700 [bacterium]|nr:hypothetical protein [bacterium]